MTATILLVEDDLSIAENVILALARDGLDCRHVALAGEGLAQLRAGGLDLVILDVGLPDGNGFDLCRTLRGFSDLPVIFLTARTDEIDRVVGLEIGADDYVPKPFSPRELAARVKSILRRSRRSADPPPPAPCAPPPRLIAVDEERALICCRGVPLELSRAEYLMLKTLAARPERVFSRGELMDAAGLAEASLARSVDTHIKALRAKLALLAPDLEPIRTHRGLGYSLIREAPMREGIGDGTGDAG
ncbi:two-component system response regulator CreB [Candidatus Thiodictyon syntrophicum]|jgi:two-component system catabolic regulation response regulator CreB|uniref:Two-component system response regulator CreB n=1 Tax=Candidatus Thiodictyon syntrophicum TaxID=1166950 RepID=A0A2K8UFZ4_9GAMM|nr:two-component system response regulator CreB [Candidatus Thiodictyon syntrophicum]AUB84484.1 two-component system response regulator CreB [Candidatus Thiodictyon syntrophicum]